MFTINCTECNTIGIVAQSNDGKLIVSPCDCVAKEG